MTVTSVVLVGILVLPLLTSAVFDESPTSQKVSAGEIAEFRCQHSTVNVVNWTIDGSLVDIRNPSPGVHVSTSGASSILTIAASLERNGTEVVCVAGGSPDEISDPAFLYVIAGFIAVPLSRNVTVGEEVEFRCNHPGANSITWTLNGIFLTRQNNFTNGSNGGSVLTLRAFDTINIYCTAYFKSGGSINSSTAIVYVQGPLDAVPSLSKVGSTLSWEPPFSLDLTNIDPDIVYCVDVYNITCGGRDLVSSDCHVTGTNYNITGFSNGYLYEYIVTPRSNVEGAENGTQSRRLTDKLPSPVMSSSQQSVGSYGRNMLSDYQLELTFNGDQQLTLPLMYTMKLESLDKREDVDRVETTAFVERGVVTLDVVHGLERERVWNCTIFAYGCEEHQVANLELSTHEFYDISISLPSAGAVRVTGRYTEGSPATGVLVMVSNGTAVYYHNATRDGSDIIQEATITGVASGEYNVSVFVVEENGLPFERAASSPRPLVVEKNRKVEPPPSSIDYSLESTSSGVCVKCTFLDSVASECVAVVHRNLMNIESSHKFTRSGDTASGCIEGVNLEGYQVGVIDGKRVSGSGKDQGCSTLCVVVIVVLVMLFVIPSLGLVLILFCKKSFNKSGQRLYSLSHGNEQGDQRIRNRYVDLPPTEISPLMVKSEDGVKKKSQDLPSFQLQLNKSTPCEYQGQQELSVYLESDPESADQHTNAGGQEYAIVDEHSDPPAGETLQDDLTKIKATEASPYSKVEPVPTTNSHSEDEPSQTVENHGSTSSSPSPSFTAEKHSHEEIDEALREVNIEQDENTLTHSPNDTNEKSELPDVGESGYSSATPDTTCHGLEPDEQTVKNEAKNDQQVPTDEAVESEVAPKLTERPADDKELTELAMSTSTPYNKNEHMTGMLVLPSESPIKRRLSFTKIKEIENGENAVIEQASSPSVSPIRRTFQKPIEQEDTDSYHEEAVSKLSEPGWEKIEKAIRKDALSTSVPGPAKPEETPSVPKESTSSTEEYLPVTAEAECEKNPYCDDDVIIHSSCQRKLSTGHLQSPKKTYMNAQVEPEQLNTKSQEMTLKSLDTVQIETKSANINNLVSESAYGTESAKESTTFSLLSDDYSVLSDGQDDLKITQTDKGVFPSVPKVITGAEVEPHHPGPPSDCGKVKDKEDWMFRYNEYGVLGLPTQQFPICSPNPTDTAECGHVSGSLTERPEQLT